MLHISLILTKWLRTHSGVATQEPLELDVEEVLASGGRAALSDPVGLAGGDT